MYNRKKRLFLTAVCLSLGLLTGCNVGNTKNYKQAAQDLEQEIMRQHLKNTRQQFLKE